MAQITITDRYLAGMASPLDKSAEAGAIAPGGSRRKAGDAQAAAEDSVQLSNVATKVEEALSADAIGRAARIERLAALYQSGRYQVDAASVSRRIVADAMAVRE